MKYILTFLSVLWQLPQDIIGFFVWAVLILQNPNMSVTSENAWLPLRFFDSGVSLGHFIFLQRNHLNPYTLRHEKGHCKQSLYFGPLYLILFGLPSFIANIIDRLFHKKWSAIDRIKWYYGKSHYWEYLADRWGNVPARW